MAVFLLLAQAPHWLRLPVWISALGTGLVLARLAMPKKKVARWLLPVLAACAGVGIRVKFGYFLARDPCVAFLFVLVGIKFIESRTVREGSLLACLGLFLALTQFFYTQSLLAGIATLPTLLALGGALAALRLAPQQGSNWRAPLLLTGRMLLQGIPIAALLFLLFPRLAGPLWGLPADAGNRTGLSDRMAPGSISELSLSDAVAFRVDIGGKVPPQRELYWRGPVLSQFDGREWSTLMPIPLASSRLRSPGREIRYTVTLEPNGKPWLFALESATNLPHVADDPPPRTFASNEVAWVTRDRQLMSRTPLLQAFRYQQTSVLRNSFPAMYGDAEENLALPPNNPRTTAFARELRASTTSDSSYVNAVLGWFNREKFVYTLSPPLLDKDPVDAFLFDTRRGFCEHYAGAFVLLMRAAGVPARVVTGYQGGEINPNGDYLIVRQSDAHAWAEVLIAGEWHRFDPTAAVAPSRIEGGLGAALPSGEPVPYLARMELTWLKSMRLHWDAVNYQWQRGVVGFNTSQQRDIWRNIGLDASRPWQPAVVLALGVMLWSLILYAAVRTRRATVDPVLQLWNALCVRLARGGLDRRHGEGPIVYAERAAARWPHAALPLRRIAETYVALRYGRPDDSRANRVAELERLIASLPSPRSLRTLPDAGRSSEDRRLSKA